MSEAKDYEVVDVGAFASVEDTTACYEPERWLLHRSVHGIGGEGVLTVTLRRLDNVGDGCPILPVDVNMITGLQFGKTVEHAGVRCRSPHGRESRLGLVRLVRGRLATNLSLRFPLAPRSNRRHEDRAR